MRSIVLVSLLALASSVLAAPAAETPAMGTSAGPATVTVCDNLVTLRKLMAQEVTRQDPDSPASEPDRTGCSEIKADKIGAVQRRTIIGGAPFECRSIENGPCQWVQP